MNNNTPAPKQSAEKTVVMIISLVIALFLWGYVIGKVNPLDTVTISDVPVQVLNSESLSDRGLALSGGASYTVSVSIEGTRADISKITASDIVATADLTGYGIGTNNIKVNVAAPTAVALKSTQPSTVDITIEELISVAKPIEVVYTGTVPAGYETGFLTLEPEQILVSGPASLVNQVATLRVNVDLTQVTETGHRFESSATPVSSGLTPVEGVQLSAGTVKGEVFLCETKDLQLVLNVKGTVAEGFGLLTDAPETIRIRSASVDLSQIETITTEEIDVTGLSQSQTVPLALVLPEGVEVADGYEELEVFLDVQQIIHRTLEIPSSQVTVENLPNSLQAMVSDETIVVEAYGPASVINILEGEDFKLTVDLQNTEQTGQNYWPLKVTYSGKDRLYRFEHRPNGIYVLVREKEEPLQ